MLLTACILGLLYLLGMRIFRGKQACSKRIPFAPFLTLGILVYLLTPRFILW
jgi:prepilin signal peptidase PulO-like enzyme (type II secretory pathway)